MTTGYQVSFDDFRRLLTDPDWSVPVVPLVRGWFGCEVLPTADGVRLRDRNGATLDLHEVHAAIQADPSRQYELYQTAMSLWR